MATFAVKFLGCKVSQADAMQARRALLAAGHTETPEAEAELHLINTCCITSEAEGKSRQSVRRSLRTAQRVQVSGCAANLNAEQFRVIDPRVTVLQGSADDVARLVVAAEHDPELEGIRGAAARERAKDYDWDDVTDRYEALCRRLAASTPGRRPSGRRVAVPTRDVIAAPSRAVLPEQRSRRVPAHLSRMTS